MGAMAQSVVFYTDRALATSPFSSNGVQVPAATFVQYGQVRVCSIPTSGIPCNTPASITDIFGNPLSIVGGNFGQITTDVVGRFSFGCTPGLYQIQVAASSSNTPLLNYPMTCPSGSTLLLSANNTWTGNQTFNGNNIFGGTNTFNAASTFNGIVSLLGGGTQTGTWAGTPTYTGATTYSGGLTSTGGLAATSGQNSLAAFSFNNIIFVDGIKYTTIASAVAACPSTGCEIWTPNNYRETLTSQLVLGTAAVGNTKPIGLRLGRDSIVTVNVTGGVCGIVVPTASSISGPDGMIGANGPPFNGAANIIMASTANVSAGICNGDTTGGQEYFSLNNLVVSDNASATVSGALVDLQAIFVPSVIRDTVILPAGHIGLRLRDVSGAGFGPFACDNCWLNGGTTAGSQPLVIQSVASGGLMSGINFYGGAIEHAGTGQFEIVVDGSAGTAHEIAGVNFYGTYCENSFAASSCFKFRDVDNWNMVGNTVGGTAGADVVNISRSGATRAGAGTIFNLKDNSGFTNIINDTTRSAITSASANGIVEAYTFFPGDFVVATGMALASGTATMTTALIASGACGSTVTVTATGVQATDAIMWSYSAGPAANPGELTVVSFPTLNGVNFFYCNPTAAGVTPAAATLNWRVLR